MRSTLTIWFNAAIFVLGFYFLGVPLWKAAVVGVAVLIATDIWYGRRWLMRIGFVLFLMTIAIWVEMLPPPDAWQALFNNLLARLR